MSERRPISAEMVPTRVGAVQVRSGAPFGTLETTPTLVYLHSAMGEGDGLAFLDELAARTPMCAPMFCGFGDSEGIESIDDMEDAVFHLLDLFHTLGVQRPVVAGTSLGGWMAAELATRYPDSISGLVLVNAVGLRVPGSPIGDIFGRPPSEMAADIFADQQHPVAVLMRMMENSMAELTAGTEIPFELVRPQYQAMAATARLGWNPYLHNPRLRARLSWITAPTLVVRGAHDRLVPEAHARAYAEEITGARLEILDSCSHMAVMEDPAELAELICAFAGSCA